MLTLGFYLFTFAIIFGTFVECYEACRTKHPAGKRVKTAAVKKAHIKAE
jgi:hypothetical protein